MGCDGTEGMASLPVWQVQLRAIHTQLNPTLWPIKRNHSLVAHFLEAQSANCIHSEKVHKIYFNSNKREHFKYK